MEYITDAAEAAKIDAISIQEIGIPSEVLMERAAMAVARCVRDECAGAALKKPKILAVCGTGNNGGDGVAAARILKDMGFDARIFLAGSEKKASGELKLQLKIARSLDVEFVERPDGDEYDVIIDALFGIGLSRKVEGEYASLIEWINERDCAVVSVDVPSGISADDGRALGCAVKACCTVTFGTKKRGLVLFPGACFCGRVIVADIGFPKKAVKKAAPKAYSYSRDDVGRLMPLRKTRTNKGSYGRLLVIAGSDGMSGACFLAAKAAYRMGCGLVSVATAKSNVDIIKIKLPEAIVSSYEQGIDFELERADAVAVGPGIGTGEIALGLVEKVLKIKDRPVVMDADALNVLAKIRRAGGGRLYGNFVITPHLKEMARLADVCVGDVADNMLKYASSMENGCVVVLKDARTVVSDGEKFYINMTGNNALATGGSGDVLCGMTAGLLAQGMKGMDAASLAVCIHGLAAEEYAGGGSRYAMIASDIIDMLPKVLPY